MIKQIIFSFVIILSALYTSAQANDSAAHADTSGYFISMSEKGDKLIIPASTKDFKVIAIKIVTMEGEEMLAQKVKDTTKPVEVDISGLAAGEYMLYIVNAQNELLKTKFHKPKP